MKDCWAGKGKGKKSKARTMATRAKDLEAPRVYLGHRTLATLLEVWKIFGTRNNSNPKQNWRSVVVFSRWTNERIEPSLTTR